MRAELDRILASEVFARSERLSAFLKFIVERTLAGEGRSLKEHVIAIELYGKGVDFNTAADPIVRVDARRLRDRLREDLRRVGRRWHRHFGSERQLYAGVPCAATVGHRTTVTSRLTRAGIDEKARAKMVLDGRRARPDGCSLGLRASSNR